MANGSGFVCFEDINIHKSTQAGIMPTAPGSGGSCSVSVGHCCCSVMLNGAALVPYADDVNLFCMLSINQGFVIV